MNHKFCDIVGYSRDEFEGLSFQEITHKDDLNADLTLVGKVINDEIKTYTLEKRYIKKSGEVVWANLTVSLVRNSLREPEFFIAVIEDIQGRKKIEEDLKDARNDLELRVQLRTSELIEANRALLAQISETNKAKKDLDRFFSLSIDHFAIANTDGQFLTVNPAFTKTLGYTHEELTSRPFIEFVHPDDRNITVKQSDGLKDGIPILEFENRYITKDGQIRWFSWKGFPVVAEGLVYAAARDQTEFRAKEDMINQQRQEIAESARLNSLGRMAAGLAHEINNPLAVLYLEAFKIREMAESNSLEQIEILKVSARMEEMTLRMTSIIKGLKSFARDSADDPFESVSVQKIIDDSLVLCESVFRKNEIKFSDESICDSIFVSARGVQLSQVLLNLLNNSIDAVSGMSEKWIKIDVVESANFVEVHVTDSGSLTDDETIAKLFEPFFTMKRVGEGTGLGLSISLGLMKEHKGELIFDRSSANTRFVMKLPKLVSN